MQITNEQFDELYGLLRQTSGLVREAFHITETVFKLLPKKTDRACVCKLTEVVGRACEVLFQIENLLKKGENHD
jgi:hypothetical protein